MTQPGSPVFRFESAVEAVITGDLAALESGLHKNPELVRARSTRICNFDPPAHRATLLHYVAANGVEGYRQKTPKNAVDVAKTLLNAGAESRHRALALAAQHGHVDVVRLLLDAGEDPSRYNPDGNHSHSTPLHQAAFAGHDAVVRLLVERGARLDIKGTIYQGTPLGCANYGKQTEIEKYLRARVTASES